MASATRSKQAEKDTVPDDQDVEVVAVENPTKDASEESEEGLKKNEEPSSMVEENKMLKAELERLRLELGKDEGSIDHDTSSIAKEYLRTAQYNVRKEGSGVPYRKPSLAEPPTFDGTEVKSDPYAFRIWLGDVFEFVTLNFPGEEQDQVRYAMRLLRKGVRISMMRWADELKVEGRAPTMTEWAQYLEKLVQPLNPADNARDAWELAKMRENEDAHDYYLRLQSYAQCLNSTDDSSIVAPITDLALAAHYRSTLHRRLKQRLTAQARILARAKVSMPTKSWEWMQLAVELEGELKEEDKDVSSSRSRKDWHRGKGPKAHKPKMAASLSGEAVPVHQNNPAGTDSGKRKKKPEHRSCYKCRERGHLAADCPKNESAPGLEWKGAQE